MHAALPPLPPPPPPEFPHTDTLKSLNLLLPCLQIRVLHKIALSTSARTRKPRPPLLHKASPAPPNLQGFEHGTHCHLPTKASTQSGRHVTMLSEAWVVRGAMLGACGFGEALRACRQKAELVVGARGRESERARSRVCGTMRRPWRR